MRLFHGTSTSRVAEISVAGLFPQPSRDNPDRVCVYLAADLGTAELYADLACQRRGGDPVILEIDGDMLDLENFQPDDYDLQNFVDDLHDPDRDGGIGLLSGVEVDERLRPYRRWHDVPAKLSLEVTGQVAYMAAIPLNAIRGLPEPPDPAPRA